MKTRKKKVLNAVLGLLVLFLVINAGWFGWRTVKYGSYCRDWEKNPFATWIVPRYIYVDDDGYDYGYEQVVEPGSLTCRLGEVFVEGDREYAVVEQHEEQHYDN